MSETFVPYQVLTAAEMNALATAEGGVSQVVGATGAVTLSELVAGGVAPLASPGFSGNPTAPNPAGSDNSNSLSTTAWVTGKIAGATAGVSQVLGFTGAVTLSELVAGGVAPSSVLAAASSVARALSARFGEEANVMDYGAVPTLLLSTSGGFAAAYAALPDSGPAFNAAFAANGAIYVPPGTYKISTSIFVNLTYCSMRGAGVGITILRNSTANVPTIVCSSQASNIFLQYGWFSDFTLDRNVTATSGGDGFRTDALNTFTIGAPYLFNIVSQHNWQGFFFGACNNGFVMFCTAQNNQSHGFSYNNGTFNAALQYTTLSCFSALNGGDGYAIATTNPTQAGSFTTSNPAYVTVGTFQQCGTYANLSNGIALLGSNVAFLCDFDWINGFVGSDGGDGLYADTYGISNRVINSTFELSSSFGTASFPNGIGPNQNVAAPMAGNSINITANNPSWDLGGLMITSPAYFGILTAAASTTITASRIFNCGLRTANTYSGICANTGHGLISVHNSVSGGPAQAFGIIVNNGAQAIIVGNDLRGNQLLGFSAQTNFYAVQIANNLGFISRNSGVTSIPVSTTSIVINHGLSPITGGVPPAVIMGSPNAQFTSTWWIDTVTATSFTLHFASATTFAGYFGWTAIMCANS